ncbi:MAG: galactosyltransferase-related protein [Novipirellula sp. JB048]
MTKPTISICIPLMVPADSPLRLRNWRVCANELTALAERRGDVEIIVAEWGGSHAEGYKHIKRVEGEGRFNRSRARNRAWRAAEADLICFIDTDMVLPGHAWDYCIEHSKPYDLFSPHRQYWRASPEVTDLQTQGDHYRWEVPIRELDPGRKPGRFVFCGGIVFFKRSAIEKVGGWDEGFDGWGKEDTAIEKMARACRLKLGYGNEARPVHLYHEPAKSASKQSNTYWNRNYKRNFKSTYQRRAKQPANVFEDLSGIKYASHLPMLCWALSQIPPSGIAVEFGAGACSTPALKLFSRLNNLTVYSWESDPKWHSYAEREFASSRFHVGHLTGGNLDSVIAKMIEAKPSVVFIDTGYLAPGKTFRNHILQRLLPVSRLVVCHDTEPEMIRRYKYNFSSASHVRHFWLAGVRTTILSNADLSIAQ